MIILCSLFYILYLLFYIQCIEILQFFKWKILINIKNFNIFHPKLFHWEIHEHSKFLSLLPIFVWSINILLIYELLVYWYLHDQYTILDIDFYGII